MWTGRGCLGLGLERGAEVEPDVMELLYGRLLDPRDPLFADKDVLPQNKTRLGAPPRNYKSFQERFDAMAAAEPDATPERLEQLAIQARKDQRQAVMLLRLHLQRGQDDEQSCTPRSRPPRYARRRTETPMLPPGTADGEGG